MSKLVGLSCWNFYVTLDRFVYLLLFQHLGWTRVASLTEEGQKYAEYVSHLQDL